MSGSSSRTPVARRMRRAVSTAAAGETDDEPGLDLDHPILEQLHAVAG